MQWSKEFKKTLRVKHNISQESISKVFKNAVLLEDVINRDKNQLHKKVSLDKYLKMILSKSRIKRGKQKFLKHKKELKNIENKYHVNAQVIVSLWGIESYYGKLQGKHIVIDALLSLIYDGRRAKFFTRELLHTIKILEKNNLKKETIKGSWAGAMGACQFMPSTYTSYAIDANKDGVKDIWNNKKDVFESIANLISKSGFKKSEPIAVEIYPTKIKQDEKISLGRLENMGLRYKSNKDIKGINKNIKAKIKQYKKRYFLVFDNFKVIKRWNNSDFFAISVALLSKHFK